VRLGVDMGATFATYPPIGAAMTINSETRVAGPFEGNDSATVFPFTFKVFAEDELYVVRAADSVETVLVLDTDYTVDLNPDQNAAPGGEVTLVAPLATDSTLTFTSDLEALQPLDLTNQGGFYPRVINNAFDRVTILIQQLKSVVSRTLKFPLSDGPVGDLPGRDARAGRVLAFDPDTAEPVAGPTIYEVETVAATNEAITIVADNIGDVVTVANNITDVTNFADVYYGPSATDPTMRRDGSPLQVGDLYFNTSSDRLRVYDGGVWHETPGGSMTVQNFSGDGAETEFQLSYTPQTEIVTQVFVGGIYQQKNTYELGGVDGDVLIFSEAPPTGTDNIEVVVSSMVSSDDVLRGELIDTSDASLGAAIIGRGAQFVGSITELRALLKTAPSKHAVMQGYHSQGDGGGGAFYLDEADTTSVDNGVTTIVADDGGRWKLEHKGLISAKQAGARGDGVTDDAVFAQKALDTGLDVVFPFGYNFRVSARLFTKATGQTVTINGTITASASMPAVIENIDYSRVTICGTGTVDGGGLAINGVQSTATAASPVGVTVKDLTVTGTAIDPFLFYGGVLFVSSGGQVSTFRHKDVSVRNVTARNCSTHGVLVAYSDGVKVDGCVFDTCANHGHESVNCTDVSITNNTAQDCAISGLGVGAMTSNWVITGNVIRNCGGDGSITAEHNSIFGLIANNVVLDANTSGINISFGTPGAAPFEKLRNIECSSNVIRQKSGVVDRAGINVYSSTSPGIGSGIKVINNIIDGFNVGITYAYIGYGEISGNIVLNQVGSNSAVVIATFVTDVTIANNSGNTVTGDHAYQLKTYGGLICNRVNLLNNFVLQSGAAASKSIIYIEGAGTHTACGNSTQGALHYIEGTGTPSVVVDYNHGNLAGTAYSGIALRQQLNGVTALTVGAAGGAAALPATPLGYTTVEIPGTGAVKVPYYSV
jgi:hypothetical protein